MLLSAVSVLVVAQSSSEIPEGFMNNPVYFSQIRYNIQYISIIRAFVGTKRFLTVQLIACLSEQLWLLSHLHIPHYVKSVL